MSKYPGRVLSATPPAVSQSGASGVWTQEEVAKYNAEGVWPIQPLPNDPYFQNVSVLLHGDGNQGATNFSNVSDPVYLAFKDNSTNNFPITMYGNAYGDNFGPFAVSDGNWSNYFDADRLNYTSPSGIPAPLAQWDGTTGTATIEAWVYPTALESSSVTQHKISTIVAIGDTYFAFGIHATGVLRLYWWTGASNVIDSTGTVPLNQWSHVAVTRNNSTITFYINGQQAGTSSSYTDMSWATASNGLLMQIGQNNGSSTTGHFYGYISNLRTSNIVRTVTLPTEPYSPDANTLFLSCLSNRFRDASSNNYPLTITNDPKVTVFNPFGELPDDVNGAGVFNGGSDYAQAGSDAALAPGAVDFTIECWIYPTGNANYMGIYQNYTDGVSRATALRMSIYQTDNTRLVVQTLAGAIILTATGTLKPNSWNHIALVRNGAGSNNLVVYVDGVSAGSATNTTNFSDGYAQIGNTVYSSVNYSWVGLISNLRVVPGTAVYTSAFTPPTAPLTNITNTELLTCQYAGTVRNIGFIDSGPYDFAFTNYSAPTQGTFAPFSKPPGRWGALTRDRAFLSIPASADFDLIGTDFTVEFWLNWNLQNTMAFSGTNFLGNMSASNGYFFGMSSTSASTFSSLNFTVWNAGSSTSNSNTAITQANLPAGEWHHVAIIRSGSNLRFYIDGVHTGSTFTSVTYSTAGGTLTMGSGAYIQNGTYSGNADYFISNLRLTKSAAVYDFDGFTPPTSPLTALASTTLLMFQDSRFINNGSNIGAITSSGHTATRTYVTPFSAFPLNTSTGPYSPTTNGGAGYFNSGSYITATPDYAFVFGTDDFTVDCWAYSLGNANYRTIVDTRASSASAGGWIVGVDGNGALYVYSNVFLLQSANNVFTTNVWNHVAFVRSGSTQSLFLNGVRVATTTTARTYTEGRMFVGGENYGTPAQFWFGYIANLRLVKGTALYNATQGTLTIPTALTTAVPNTSLLLNFANAGIYDNACTNAIGTVGNAQVDTSIVKFGTGSMKFDGTGDNLTIASTPGIWFAQGPFTIELWLYPNNASASQMIIAASDTNGVFLGMNIDGANRIALGRKGVAVDTFVSYAYTAGVWIHLACTRDSSNNVRFFVNGTQVGSTASNSISYANSALNVGFEPTQNYLNAHIDDLRITKGVARYTTNFDPPTIPFRNIGA